MHPSTIGRSIVTAMLHGCLFSTCVVTTGIAQTPTTDELLQAIQERDVAEVASLLDEQPELASSRIQGIVPVLLAAVFAKAPGAPFERPEANELVAVFLSKNPDLGIHEAAVLGRFDRLSELVAADASLVQEAAASGWTPLHFAAFSGNLDCVRLLLENGADVHRRATRSSKITPLVSAMFTRRFEVVEYLLEHGADALVRVHGGFSAMHEAALVNDPRLVQLLYDRGAELDSRTDEGETPLDTAGRGGGTEAAALLRILGARRAEEIDAEKPANG